MMATVRRIDPIKPDTGHSLTEDFGQPLYNYPGCVVFSHQSIFASSSVTAPLVNPEIYILGGSSFVSNDKSDKINRYELVEVPDSMIFEYLAECDNRIDDTDSNKQEQNYEEPILSRARLKVKELWSLLEQDPIEDGCSHSAETLVEDSLKSSVFDLNHWLYIAYFENIDVKPMLSTAILRLLGRMPYSLVGQWGIIIAISGISHNDIELRDAAIRALERWGGHEAFIALNAHVDAEPIPWLAAYIRQVIIDSED